MTDIYSHTMISLTKKADGIFDENFDTGVVQNDQKIDVDSRLLTLSTCCGMDGKRWIVQSVLTGEIEADAR